MSTELEKATDFQTRMFEKIREQMGELLTDAELKQIVEKAMDKAFTERVQTHRVGRYGSQEVFEVEAPFVGMVRDLLAPSVHKVVAGWLTAHPDEVKKIIDDALKDGIVKMVVQYFENKVSGPISEMRYKMEQALTLQR
jgi:hypothetical protein